MKHQATASSLMSFKSQPLIFWGKRLCIYSPDSLCWTHSTSQHTVWWFWLTLPYVSLTHGGCPGDNLCLLIHEMHYAECLSWGWHWDTNELADLAAKKCSGISVPSISNPRVLYLPPFICHLEFTFFSGPREGNRLLLTAIPAILFNFPCDHLLSYTNMRMGMGTSLTCFQVLHYTEQCFTHNRCLAEAGSSLCPASALKPDIEHDKQVLILPAPGSLVV